MAHVNKFVLGERKVNTDDKISIFEENFHSLHSQLEENA